MSKLKKVRKWVNRMVDKWSYISDIALPVVEEVVEFQEAPGLFSGARMLMRLHDTIDTFFYNEDEEVEQRDLLFTEDPEWIQFVAGIKPAILIGQIKALPHRAVPIKDTMGYAFIHLPKKDNPEEDCIVGYADLDKNNQYICFKKGDKDTEELLKDIIWKYVNNQAIYAKDEAGVWWLEAYNSGPCFETDISKRYSKEVMDYKEKGYNHSILFYGPPGTGKTSSAAVVIKDCSKRSLILTGIHELNFRHLTNIISRLNPDSILIEDIDHCIDNNIGHLLSLLEFINKSNCILIATCNKIQFINDAIFRSGRFDELVSINTLPENVVRSFIPDEEIFQQVKSFPIASILEVKKRIEVLGKKEAMRRLGDIKSRVERAQRCEDYCLGDEENYNDEDDGDDPDS